jgi:hypothetical protein
MPLLGKTLHSECARQHSVAEIFSLGNSQPAKDREGWSCAQYNRGAHKMRYHVKYTPMMMILSILAACSGGDGGGSAKTPQLDTAVTTQSIAQPAVAVQPLTDFGIWSKRLMADAISPIIAAPGDLSQVWSYKHHVRRVSRRSRSLHRRPARMPPQSSRQRLFSSESQAAASSKSHLGSTTSRQATRNNRGLGTCC